MLVAYVLWALFGIFGAHHLYLGRNCEALVSSISLNGFLLGWVRDAFRIPSYVRQLGQAEAEAHPSGGSRGGAFDTVGKLSLWAVGAIARLRGSWLTYHALRFSSSLDPPLLSPTLRMTVHASCALLTLFLAAGTTGLPVPNRLLALSAFGGAVIERLIASLIRFVAASFWALVLAGLLMRQTVPLTVDGRERTLNAARFVSGGMCMLRPDRLARFVIHALGGGGWQEHACLKIEWSRALGTAFERLCIFSGDRRTSKCFDWDIK
ncbi:DNAj-like subfamily c member 22-like protein, partial [Chrysochromulina tobinii]